MTEPPTAKQLTEALRAAGSAHHEFETNALNGVYDEQWPGWYAAYVIGRLGDFAAPSRLAAWLEQAPQGGDWASDAAQTISGELATS